MTQVKGRIISLVLALAMLISLVSVMTIGASAASAGITEASGWLESAYVEWTTVSGARRYEAFVSGNGGSSWTKLDDSLIRKYSGYWRADAVGLKAGTYQMKVVAYNGAGTQLATLTTDNLEVKAHDRSGYGFVTGKSLKGGQNVSTSSGAYNDDGTLKSNAVVVYVTNENKDSVKATIGGKSYTGLSNILASSVLKIMTTPLCIRIIGNITDLNGGGAAFDKGDLLIDNNGISVGLTIEGIGEDAVCNGFGIRLKNSSNVEIRNLAVMNCDSDEGDNIGIQQTCDHIWVHNCDLFYGHAGGDADQVKGDGALDTKKSEYVTHSYNHFWDTGKSNLQGGSTSDTSNYITYHHNWYDHSDSRHPRVRVAEVHVYNNYYDGISKYGIGGAYNCTVISEGNYFRNTKNPMLLSTMGSDKGINTMSGEKPGTLTSYNDYVIGATSWIPNVAGIQGATSWNASDYDCVIVNTKYTAYSYTLQSAEDAKESVMKYAGRVNGGDFKWTFGASEDTNYDVIPGLKSAITNYKSSIVSIGGTDNTSCDHNGATTTQRVEATCTEDGSVKTICSSCGEVVGFTTIPASGHQSYNSVVTAPTCTEQGYTTHSCTKCGSSYKDSYVDAKEHTSGSSVVTKPTCLEDGYTTHRCSTCSASYVDTPTPATGHTPGAAATCLNNQTCTVCGNIVTPALGHKYESGSCTRCGAAKPAVDGFQHNFTDSWTNENFNYGSTSKIDNGKHGKFTYNFGFGEQTLNYALKFNSTGSLTFTPKADGTITIAIASANSGCNMMLNDVEIASITATKTLVVATAEVKAGVEYTLKRGKSVEFGLYYFAYEPNAGDDAPHVHDYKSEITTQPTCTTPGVETHTCACGETYTVAIKAKGHSHEIVDYALTGCTTDGYVKYACACGDNYKVVDVAKGHEYISSVTTEATCTTAGVKTFTCYACSDSYTEDIPAIGHTYSLVSTSNPTCTTVGVKTYECACGDSYDDETPATGHSFENGVCSTCGASDPDYVAPHTHSYTSAVTTTPDCTTNGVITYTCSCGHSYTEAIEANGHSFENGVCTDCEAADPNYNPPVDETPDENPDETPEENPEETPNETPDETPDDGNQKPTRKTFWQKLADFFRAIGNFFVRLFTGKKN